MKRSSTVPAPQSESRSQGTAGAHVALVAVQLIFGTWPIVGKVALRELPSTGLVAFRVLGATAAFFLILRSRGRVTVPRRADLLRLALYGLLGVVLNQLFFVKGIALSTVVNAALIGTAIPVFTLLVGALFGFERLSARTALGTLVAAAGVVYLIDPLRADFSGGKALGNLLLVCSNVAYGSYIAVSRDVFRRYGALNAMAWVFAFACIPTIPLGGYYLSRIPLSQLSWMTWASVTYIVLVPTVGAYYLNALALERVAPSTVAVYIYLQPLVAFAAAPLLLGADEQWVARNWVAAALIFTGVAVVTIRARSRAIREISEQPDAIGH